MRHSKTHLDIEHMHTMFISVRHKSKLQTKSNFAIAGKEAKALMNYK